MKDRARHGRRDSITTIYQYWQRRTASADKRTYALLFKTLCPKYRDAINQYAYAPLATLDQKEKP